MFYSYGRYVWSNSTREAYLMIRIHDVYKGHGIQCNNIWPNFIVSANLNILLKCKTVFSFEITYLIECVTFQVICFTQGWYIIARMEYFSLELFMNLPMNLVLHLCCYIFLQRLLYSYMKNLRSILEHLIIIEV